MEGGRTKTLQRYTPVMRPIKKNMEGNLQNQNCQSLGEQRRWVQRDGTMKLKRKRLDGDPKPLFPTLCLKTEGGEAHSEAVPAVGKAR